MALTFDDGPQPELTPRLLDLLKARGIPATFFVIGEACARYPDVLRRTRAEGHEIGNHTWTHPYLTRISTDEVVSELQRTTAIIDELTGGRPSTMRPPYLDTNDAMEQLIGERFGLRVIGASVSSFDWRDLDPNVVTAHILAGVAPGKIIVCHDNRPTTIDAMPGTLDAMLARGFKFVTVSELIAQDKSDP